MRGEETPNDAWLLILAGVFDVAARWYGFHLARSVLAFYVASAVIVIVLVVIGLSRPVAVKILILLDSIGAIVQLIPPQTQRLPVFLLAGVAALLAIQFLRRRPTRLTAV